ncbi:unnamed protein product [Colias eurytheme]|nr:unnamed protein product [Colias eurytheme]
MDELMELLTEELFPNQQVEVQLEIDGSNYRGSGPKRYNLRQTRVETTTIPTTAATKIVVKTMNAEVATNSDTDRPVYMSDLKKVLEDYEKKHSSRVHVEPDVGKPTEEGMSWFQIKIPRT